MTLDIKSMFNGYIAAHQKVWDHDRSSTGVLLKHSLASARSSSTSTKMTSKRTRWMKKTVPAGVPWNAATTWKTGWSRFWNS